MPRICFSSTRDRGRDAGLRSRDPVANGNRLRSRPAQYKTPRLVRAEDVKRASPAFSYRFVIFSGRRWSRRFDSPLLYTSARTVTYLLSPCSEEVGNAPVVSSEGRSRFLWQSRTAREGGVLYFLIVLKEIAVTEQRNRTNPEKINSCPK